MKILLLIVAVFAFNFAQAKQVPLDTKTSILTWVGQKQVPGGDHNGTVKVKSGNVEFGKDMALTGGMLVIDMTSIDNKDLSGDWKKKLEGHLNSEDFFHVKKFPDAKFKITKVEKTRSDLVKVTGDLTIRDKTNSETFEVKVAQEGKTWVATGDLMFDRTKYGVTYNSQSWSLKNAVKVAKDKIIKDQIKLSLKLATQAI